MSSLSAPLPDVELPPWEGPPVVHSYTGGKPDREALPLTRVQTIVAIADAALQGSQACAAAWKTARRLLLQERQPTLEEAQQFEEALEGYARDSAQEFSVDLSRY